MKTATLKTESLRFALLLCLLFLFNINCEKNEDDNPPPEEGEVVNADGISEDELDTYQGDLGLLVKTRDLVKKGYNPAKVVFDLTTNSGDFDQEVSIDQVIDIAKLSIPVSSLTEDQEAELRNGVPITISILDSNNQVIVSEDYSTITINENRTDVNLDNPSLPYNDSSINFHDGMPYYIQTVDVNGNFDNRVVKKNPFHGTDFTLMYRHPTTFIPSELETQYFIKKLSNSTNEFVMWSRHSGRFLEISANDSFFRQSGITSHSEGMDYNSLNDIYRFKINREANGLYSIGDINGNPLRVNESGSLNFSTESGADIYFRIVALDVVWETEDLSTTHLPPIFPRANTSFAHNETINNCSNGDIVSTVGESRTVTASFTSSYEETIGLSARITSTVGVSVTAQAEASFFGNGGSVSGTVSGELEVSTEVSSETTVYAGETNEVSQEYFSSRTITVPSGSATLVYDAYQTYSNVKVPYVKRFRLRGEQVNSGTGNMSGESVATQLNMSNFTGTIEAIGSDFVEITVSGFSIMDNISDSLTNAQDVAVNCN